MNRLGALTLTLAAGLTACTGDKKSTADHMKHEGYPPQAVEQVSELQKQMNIACIREGGGLCKLNEDELINFFCGGQNCDRNDMFAIEGVKDTCSGGPSRNINDQKDRIIQDGALAGEICTALDNWKCEEGPWGMRADTNAKVDCVIVNHQLIQ